MSDVVAGFFAPWAVFAAVGALHLVLPTRRMAGYARHERTGEVLQYRVNGWLVFVITLAVWCALCMAGLMPWDWLWQQRWPSALGALVLGLAASAATVLGAPASGRRLLAELYLGRRANPQPFGGRADAKMYLYLAGAVLLELNVLSFAAHHWDAFGDDPSPGVALYVVLMSWFVVDYLVFERVHLYTYDLFAERVGFKLIWGCLFWYPYFYAVGLWAVADLANPDAPAWLLVLAALVFLGGWVLARGANLQKFSFKREPDRAFLGIAPKALSDGERHVLVSGFWGVSRHVNYLGEIAMGVGLALALGRPSMLAPWLYPLYYVALLVPRERADDRRCAAKYGPLWDQYRAEVRWRIVPGLY